MSGACGGAAGWTAVLWECHLSEAINAIKTESISAWTSIAVLEWWQISGSKGTHPSPCWRVRKWLLRSVLAAVSDPYLDRSHQMSGVGVLWLPVWWCCCHTESWNCLWTGSVDCCRFTKMNNYIFPTQADCLNIWEGEHKGDATKKGAFIAANVASEENQTGGMKGGFWSCRQFMAPTTLKCHICELLGCWSRWFSYGGRMRGLFPSPFNSPVCKQSSPLSLLFYPCLSFLAWCRFPPEQQLCTLE